jgi:predicted DNA binding CopG/RHH family protein
VRFGFDRERSNGDLTIISMKKNRKINIRISENDLSALQRRAAREGIPYQTLIGSVLHKYVSGFLKEAR